MNVANGDTSLLLLISKEDVQFISEKCVQIYLDRLSGSLICPTEDNLQINCNCVVGSSATICVELQDAGCRSVIDIEHCTGRIDPAYVSALPSLAAHFPLIFKGIRPEVSYMLLSIVFSSEMGKVRAIRRLFDTEMTILRRASKLNIPQRTKNYIQNMP